MTGKRNLNRSRLALNPKLIDDQFDQLFKKLSGSFSRLIGIRQRIPYAANALLNRIDDLVDFVRSEMFSVCS